MGRACGLSYADAVLDAETLERHGVRIPLASPATLIRAKDTRRPQDSIDRATHYNHNSFVANEKSLFHWALVRDEVTAEVAIARAARKGE